MEQLEKLEATDKQQMILMKRLNNIKMEIGIADIPELIQIREKEITEFSGKLRVLESDYLDLKKQL